MKKMVMSFVVILSALSLFGAEKPNILFLFADDQCYETIRALGHVDIDTPNLDRLVERGATFTHTYNMGAWNGAVCAASRAMLNTGRFVWRANQGPLKDEVKQGRMWSQQMKKAGYTTYMTGKWHVKADPNEIFDVVRDIRGGMPGDFRRKGSKDGTKPAGYGYNRPQTPEDYETGWKPWDTSNGGFWAGRTHWSEVIGNHGVDYLEMAAKDDKPFFMYLAFNAAHDPRQAPKEYVDMYPLDRIPVPENFSPKYEYQDEMGCGPDLRDAALAPFPRTEYSVQVNRQEYYALITHMDAQIGRILDALEKSGKADNTYIFFTADHGLAIGHHGLIGKQNMYEHSMRPPMMVVGPGVQAGAKIDTPVYLQDVMATALDLTGKPIPDHVEFKSLMPLLNGENVVPYPAIYGAYKKNLQRMIIQGDYKLIIYPGPNAYRLFNLKKDPQEMADLAGNPEYARVLDEMKVAFNKLAKEMDDTLDLKSPGNPDFKVPKGH